MSSVEASPLELLRDLCDLETLADGFTPVEQQDILYDWRLWRRPKQTPPPGDWRVWLILAGRGFGKTRTGAEYIREAITEGTARHVALVGPTAADVRDTMIEGESGLLAVFPPDQRPKYEPSKRRVTFRNGAVATAFSADEPDRLRGPNHDLAWADELAAWRYPEAWDMLVFGLRVGDQPRVVVTTTPRPTAVIRSLVGRHDVVLARGSTYENRSNLAGAFLDEILDRYEGTRLGRQELHAEILADVEGALWDRDSIDDHRVMSAPDLVRVVVAIDPAASAKASSSETGVVVAGLGTDGHGYILDDRTTRGTPLEWASAAVAGYHLHNADRLVAEANQGGDMVRHTIETVEAGLPLKMVHASRGKRTRAEPVAALYEQGRVHHVGAFIELEDQLCGWVPGVSESPDRLDALVWALTELMVAGSRQAATISPISLTQSNPWKPR